MVFGIKSESIVSLFVYCLCTISLYCPLPQGTFLSQEPSKIISINYARVILIFGNSMQQFRMSMYDIDDVLFLFQLFDFLKYELQPIDKVIVFVGKKVL